MTQEQALDILKTGESVFLTGEPGAGKTHTVNLYVQYLRDHQIEPAITASTGIAATHIHGMTIHSWSGIGIKQVLTKDDFEKMAHNRFINRRLLKASVLIIDEVSMLSARTLDLVDSVCRKVRNIARPFGGLQVVLVGDFFQLPPVSRGEESDSRFCFESDVWQELAPTVCYLTEQHRQDDQDFLSMLSAVRSGDYTEEHRRYLQGRVGRHEQVIAELPRLFPHNADVDTINTRELRKLTGGEREFLMQSSGPDKFVEALKRGCLSPERLILKIGASVMCTKNNSELGFMNGTLGVVSGFSPDNGQPMITTINGQKIIVAPMEWDIEEEGKVRASISQIPLRLAWAMTIHKSQGMSMDAAVIDLSSCFEFGQGYVALSRVRRLSGLHLLGFNERALQVHPEVLSRDEEFHQRSAAAASGLEYSSRDERLKLQEDFLVACGGKIKKQPAGSPSTANRKSKTEKSEWLAKKREKSPNAYEPWKNEDDDSLRLQYKSGATIQELCELFGRNSGSIRSRLKKLELIDF